MFPCSLAPGGTLLSGRYPLVQQLPNGYLKSAQRNGRPIEGRSSNLRERFVRAEGEP